MSSPPPPFQPNQPPNYGSPGLGQPGTFPAGGIGAPAWQSGGSSPLTGLQPSPETPSRSRKPLIIAVVAVVAILVVVGIVVLGGGDDKGGGSVDAVGAHNGLKAVLRDGSYTDGSETIDDCPLGDLDDLSAVVAGKIDIDNDVIDGEQVNTLFDKDPDFPGFASCQVSTDKDVDGPYGLYFQAILKPARDYEGYVGDLYGDTTTLDFDDTQEYLGGEVFLFCGEPIQDDGYTGCDADWVNTDEDIALNVFLYGTDATTKDAFAALKAVLPTMASNLAEKADPAGS
ncbi:MAG: hypothetical protein ABIR32_22200 [Ilumatobacteraceae bacterium]